MNLAPIFSLPGSILLAIALSGAPATAEQAENQLNPRFAQIILFVPSDIDLPAGYQKRLHDIAIRTENFFATGIEQWGWKLPHQEIFARTASGEIQVTVTRGELPEDATGRQGFPLVMPLAMAGATKALGDEVNESTVWWVFYHTPNRVIKGFRGGGDRDGGRAINIYPTADGEISPTIDLSAPEMWPLNLKGCLHEFGHALGLPHIGPKPSSQLGNTLIGPVNRTYAKRLPEKQSDSRVFLCAASATLLAKHPLFVSQRPIRPAGKEPIKVVDLTLTETPNHTIAVQGAVTGQAKAHSVMVLDSDRRRGDYWSRSYPTKVGDDGEFQLSLDEPFDSPKGFLTLYVCLEDGRNKATGPTGVMRFRYEGKPGERRLTLNESI